MKRILERLESIVTNSTSFGHAILDIAEDLGISNVGHSRLTVSDITNTLPSHENISATEFRLAMATVIVRHFAFEPDVVNKDNEKVPYFRAVYERLRSTGEFTGADMQSYHTMMFILHPQPEDKQCPQCPVKKR